MILERLTLINYKNIREASLELSPKINCMIGRNGVGKTNILDAVYFLSFCHSASNPIDSQVIRHDEDFLFVEGIYSRKEEGGKRKENTPATDNTSADSSSDSASNISPSSFLLPLSSKISCGMKRGSKKHFRRDKKEYRRLSEHIGLIPLVMVSPADTLLIDGGSEERRRLMDMVISQYDRPYMESVGRYNKALLQRNALLKQEEEPDAELLGLWEEQMAAEGERIYQRRDAFVRELTPIFQRYYERISDCREQVAITYESHCQRGPLLDVIQRDRQKDRIMGYSLHGVHRDDLVFTLGGHPIRREGSQGQHKTFVVALKLAQFDFLKRTNGGNTPILLLDDIFDKLDASRVEQIVTLVAGEEFGQIFITDTNREHLDQILAATSHDYKIFHVEDGEIASPFSGNHL